MAVNRDEVVSLQFSWEILKMSQNCTAMSELCQQVICNPIESMKLVMSEDSQIEKYIYDDCHSFISLITNTSKCKRQSIKRMQDILNVAKMILVQSKMNLLGSDCLVNVMPMIETDLLGFTFIHRSSQEIGVYFTRKQSIIRDQHALASVSLAENKPTKKHSVSHFSGLKLVEGSTKDVREVTCYNKSKFQGWYKNIKDEIRARTWNLLAIDIEDIPVYWLSFEPVQEIITQISEGHTPSPQVTMRYEILRFCTFRTYPKDNKPFILRLAQAGFYYAADADGVVCYTCGIRRYNWTEDEIPRDIHVHLNPSCKFLTKNNEVNVPVQYYGPIRKCIAFLETIPDVEPSRRVLTETVDHSLSGPTPQSHQSSSENQANEIMGVNTALPKHPQYAIISDREASFRDWLPNASQTPQVLADAGFYFAGLRHWTADDDPWIEHARWAKTCVYVKQKKGQEFVNLVQLAVQYSQDNDQQTGSAGNSLPDQEIEKILLSDAAQCVLEMGYQPKIIKKAIEVLLRLNGQTNLPSATILEKVLELEEESHKNNAQEAPIWPSASTAEKSYSEKGKQENKTTAGQSDGEKKTQEDPKAIKAENKVLKEKSMCKVCMDNTICIVFLPCGHLVTCADCAPAMRKCPICRAVVRGTVRTYMT